MADFCLECRKVVTNDHQAVFCTSCRGWQHRECGTGISNEQYLNYLRYQTSLNWLCKCCNEKISVDKYIHPPSSSDSELFSGSDSFSSRGPHSDEYQLHSVNQQKETTVIRTMPIAQNSYSNSFTEHSNQSNVNSPNLSEIKITSVKSFSNELLVGDGQGSNDARFTNPVSNQINKKMNHAQSAPYLSERRSKRRGDADIKNSVNNSNPERLSVRNSRNFENGSRQVTYQMQVIPASPTIGSPEMVSVQYYQYKQYVIL